MKITKLEKKELNELLHELIALRDGNKCLRCNKSDWQKSHIYPKGRYKKLEFDDENIIPLCYACHLHFWHKNPIEAHEWLQTVIDKKRLDRLRLRSQTSGDGTRNYKLLKIYLESKIKKLIKEICPIH